MKCKGILGVEPRLHHKAPMQQVISIVIVECATEKDMTISLTWGQPNSTFTLYFAVNAV